MSKSIETKIIAIKNSPDLTVEEKLNAIEAAIQGDKLPDVCPSPFHERVRWLRIKKNLTQKQVAATLAVSVQTYNRLESGKTIALTEDKYQSLSEVLEVPVETLALSKGDLISDFKVYAISNTEAISQAISNCITQIKSAA